MLSLTSATRSATNKSCNFSVAYWILDLFVSPVELVKVRRSLLLKLRLPLVVSGTPVLPRELDFIWKSWTWLFMNCLIDKMKIKTKWLMDGIQYWPSFDCSYHSNYSDPLLNDVNYARRKVQIAKYIKHCSKSMCFQGCTKMLFGSYHSLHRWYNLNLDKRLVDFDIRSTFCLHL